METNYLVTEDNLIGSVATAMLKLKVVKDKKEAKNDLSNFIGLIEFLKEAKNSDYEKLLYDKNFFVSANVLNNLHTELNNSNISSLIDLKNLSLTLSKIVKSDDAASEDINTATLKLKQLAEILLHIKAKNQLYM